MNNWLEALKTLACSYADRNGEAETIMLLSFDGGMSVKEIAEVMDMTEKEVQEYIDNYC